MIFENITVSKHTNWLHKNIKIIGKMIFFKIIRFQQEFSFAHENMSINIDTNKWIKIILLMEITCMLIFIQGIVLGSKFLKVVENYTLL